MNAVSEINKYLKYFERIIIEGQGTVCMCFAIFMIRKQNKTKKSDICAERDLSGARGIPCRDAAEACSRKGRGRMGSGIPKKGSRGVDKTSRW